MLPRAGLLTCFRAEFWVARPMCSLISGIKLSSSSSRGNRCGSLTRPFPVRCSQPEPGSGLRKHRRTRSLKQSGMLHSNGSSNSKQVAVVVPAFQFPEPQKWLALSSAFGLAAVPSLRALDKAQQGKRLFTFPDETTRGQWSTLAGGCGCRTRKVGRSF